MSTIRMDGLLSPLLLSLLAFTIGYQAHSLLSTRSSDPSSLLAPVDSASAKPKSTPTPTAKRTTSSAPSAPSVASGSAGSGTDTESDAEDSAAALSSDLSSTQFKSSEEMKLVLVVNDELKMTKGKIAAQAGHATLACAMTLKEANPRLFRAWQNQGQPKIALRCANTEELEILAAQARSLNLCARTIRDA
ncbi:peptidyl-tRNA hydrolase [Kwoniella heveanensis BCC8398]|uniref:peptidyl-tRNA hydrolase n=1 Tax=Kwoniella heveanensis BCC8398 TaxID=1296120 RepID=A0A1B9GT68_9TREE|nr:peptidyl-tRNA hydrolase [Kwoniella heveanensis BCC8398]